MAQNRLEDAFLSEADRMESDLAKDNMLEEPYRDQLLEAMRNLLIILLKQIGKESKNTLVPGGMKW